MQVACDVNALRRRQQYAVGNDDMPKTAAPELVGHQVGVLGLIEASNVCTANDARAPVMLGVVFVVER